MAHSDPKYGTADPAMARPDAPQRVPTLCESASSQYL
jgi:hypothetical protein